MMRSIPTPSVKTLVKVFPHVDPVACKKMRRMMREADTHATVDAALDFADKVLLGYGVEALRGAGWRDYYLDINLLYVNRGDSYLPTILYDTHKDRFYVASWGDYIEARGNRARFKDL